MELAPSTVALSVYNALCVLGQATPPEIGRFVFTQGAGALGTTAIRSALEELKRRGLVQRNGESATVRQKASSIVQSRDRTRDGWAHWIARHPIRGIVLITDKQGMATDIGAGQ